MERKRVINVDLSTKCTLECPKCPRYFFTKYNLKYTGHRMTDDEFEKISNYFQGILFCGQASDPMLHPKFSDFLKITKEKDIYTWVNTAVSHPPKSWYIKAFLEC
tara:strand:+ start:322 stop:636 length:315 start_codon:yes stop_codon:yes gene_type:complete